MTKPKDTTKLSIAERTKQVLRVNQENPAHALAPLSDKNPPRYVRGGALLIAKLPGMAASANNNLFDRGTYVPGDGERMQSGRPGADDHLKVRSRGYSV